GGLTGPLIRRPESAGTWGGVRITRSGTHGRVLRADSRVRSAVRALLANRKAQILLNGGFGIVLLVVAFFSARHFMRAGWPLHHADPMLVGVSALLFFVAYAFKAWGWQRLFAKQDRPTSQALAFARGAACVGGIALPGRTDDVVRIACARRFPGSPP